MKLILFGLLFFIPLYRQYKLYRQAVYLSAQKIYNERRNDKGIDWAREYLTRRYLEKRYLGYWEWLRRVYGGR